MANAVITGASRGLGLELVKQLAVLTKPSTTVFALCRNPCGARELNDFVKIHENVKIIKADMANFDLYKDVVEEISQHVKEGGLNLLVNNAGVMIRDTTSSVSAKNIVDSCKVNTVAPLIFTQSVLSLMVKANSQFSFGSFGKALVLNISSQLGSIKENNTGEYVSYRLSKAALNMATKALAVELKPLDIFVLAMNPGWVKTGMGGDEAPMTAENSVKGMLKTAFQATEKHRGGFLSYDGRTVPW